MRIALLSGGAGWHVRDLQRAAATFGHTADIVDFRRLHAAVAAGPGPLDSFDAVVVRTMPPGSLEQVVFRMDLLHRLHDRGVRVLNPPRALEICIDKFLATSLLDAAGLPVPPTVVCQTADEALAAFESLGRDVVVKPLFGSEGRGMMRDQQPRTGLAHVPHPGTHRWRFVCAAIRATSRLGLARVGHCGGSAGRHAPLFAQ